MKEIELLKIIFKDSPDILEPLNKIDKEIERLKLELLGYRQAILQDKEMLGLKQENERLHSIIKEAIEYMEDNSKISLDDTISIINFYRQLLEILKGSE